MKNRIAFIGSGKVSKFHIDAALEAGFTVTAISATDKSKSALERLTFFIILCFNSLLT